MVKLLQARFIREVPHITWLVNVVHIKKSSGEWHMCMDFLGLNKACPKDLYPLPNVDQFVENPSAFRMPSFKDTFTG